MCQPSARFLPPAEAVLAALTKYSIPSNLHVFPAKSLYQLRLLRAPHRSIEGSALASQYGLECAATAILGYLLAYNTSQLSGDLAMKMNTV